MTKSNNIKGLVALLASLFIAIGTVQFMSGNQTVGIVLISLSALGQALKHWADTQPSDTPDPTQPDTSGK